MQFSRGPLDVGQHVRARGRLWRIDGTQRGERGTWVALRAADADVTGTPDTCALIWPHDPLPAAALPRLRHAPLRRAARHICAALGAERREDDLWCATDADVEVHPWQLAPVAAVLRGATRVLLADDVGLGKTVEASLIVAELRARQWMRRALVLAPVALAPAWLEMLRTRFQLDAVPVTAHDLQRWQHRPAAAGNPWQQASVIVASIDLAKQPTAMASLETVGFDVLVVDEAHHAVPSTARGALVARLALRTPWVVLCTATPHAGDRAQFDALCRMGGTGLPSDVPMQIFRRHRGDIDAVTPGRSLRVLRARLAPGEAQLHARLDAYVRALQHGPAGREPGVQLLCIVLARRLASSPEALRQTLTRRLSSLDSTPRERDERQPSLFESSAEDEEDDGEGDDPWSGRLGLHSLSDERQQLAHLCEAASGLGSGAKLRMLQRLLRRTREPVVVFSEFRATVLATARALPADVRPAVLHGGLTPEVRAHVLEGFLRGAARVLLTTDVAGEGLNLQHRSRLVVTLDWPWRPHRLEQRIGRVDRLGQQRRVHALVLSARAPSDDRMREVLQRHSDEAEAALRAHRLAEPATDTRLLASRIRQLRRWCRLGHDIQGDAVAGVWAAPARRRRSSTVAVVCVVHRLTAEGQVAWRRLAALSVTLPPDSGRQPGWKRIARQLATLPRIADACRHAAATHASRGYIRPGPALARMADIRRILNEGSTARMQPSMFDRRAETRAEACARARATIDAHLALTARGLAAIDASAHDPGANDAVSVVAVLPLHGSGCR